VRLFVSEFLCSGGLSDEPLSDSLLREGRAMLLAVIDDALRIPKCQVTTTLDVRLAAEGQSGPLSRCLTVVARSRDEELQLLRRFAGECDFTLIIAPETDGVLERRVCEVISAGGRSLNCSPEAIALCGDKLQLADHLESRGIPTVSTRFVNWSDRSTVREVGSELVIKPRDGAGSWLTFRISADSSADWQHAESEYARSNVSHKALMQPFIAGQSLSVSCLCLPGGITDIFPIGQQNLSPRFQYLGGEIPVSLPDVTVNAIQDLIQQTCQSIPGLSGYVGFDLILPDLTPRQPLVIEINPRLTTSCVGYRSLCEGNVLERWLNNASGLSSTTSALRWKSGRVVFDAAGRVEHR
jgi:tyramine---L-glutamate ligase